MTPETSHAVDRELERLLLSADPPFGAALEASAAAGLPAIAVSPLYGKMLHILVQAIQARRVLEVGSLGGYSTLWLASALPAEGRVITLEIDPKNAAVATENLRRFGLLDRVEIRIGPAVQSLDAMRPEDGPFDLAFIDADKQNNPAYLAHAVRLSRPGGLIVLDNVVRAGAILDPNADVNAAGARNGLEWLAQEPRVAATAIQTLGVKGYDGFALAWVKV
jgi:predicted O-methyltransferase YrrM